MCIAGKNDSFTDFEVFLEVFEQQMSIKATLVGNSNVGKSFLIHTYQHDKFPGHGKPIIHEGWTGVLEIDDQMFQLDPCEVPGYPDFERLRLLGYRETDVCAICFSVIDRFSFECITTKWIPEITTHCPNVPFLIIATKDDLREDQIRDNLLFHGYMRKYHDNTPLEIVGIIEQYMMTKHDLINDKEAEILAQTVGAYKYMACSSLKLRGLTEIFEQIGRCYMNQNADPNPVRHKRKSCCVL